MYVIENKNLRVYLSGMREESSRIRVEATSSTDAN
jgi:hypothetical protein